MKAYDWLGEDLCTAMTDVSLAAVRGTVESGQFISPFTLKRPFSISTEFGQVIAGGDSTELIQKLLDVLEEGVVTVSLGKISYLSSQQKKEAEAIYGVRFLDSNTFTYKTDWVLMAGTYNKKFLVDNAFESRFNIIIPEKKLDNSLIRYVNSSAPYMMDVGVAERFREEIKKNEDFDTRIQLDESILGDDRQITPRFYSNILSYVLCRRWWGMDTPDELITHKIDTSLEKSASIWKSADDKVFESIETDYKTASIIADETGLSKRQVYTSLKGLRATRIISGDGQAKWGVL